MSNSCLMFFLNQTIPKPVNKAIGYELHAVIISVDQSPAGC